MIAQDTGSAIVGPARADIYFGAGDEAARIAGRIKNPGTFVMLVPRELDPVAAGSDVPLPPTRPGIFGFNFDTMPDPTAPDGDEVPLPEAKPAIAAGANAAPTANGKSNARRRR
jgi:membrane-bound lytic murein transglycosylase A